MTETTKDSHRSWLDRFTDELQQRHVAKSDIRAALDGVHEHLSDSGRGPSAEFGDPREYAAGLGLPTGGKAFGCGGLSWTAWLTAAAAFSVFAIAITRWMDGENHRTVLVWVICAAAVLLAASVWLTISIARSVVAAIVREPFVGTEAGRWRRWAPLAFIVPWALPISAVALAAAAALDA